MEATHERSAKVVKSPREAAMGVATLSGFIDKRRETRITATMIKPKTGGRGEEQRETRITATMIKPKIEGRGENGKCYVIRIY